MYDPNKIEVVSISKAGAIFSLWTQDPSFSNAVGSVTFGGGLPDPGYTGTVTGTDFFFDPNINADMPPRDLQHLIALYDGEIRWTDYYVGRIIDDLARSGLLEQTVVVITSDHGTEFFEHGFKAHRMTLFDEVIRIPLLIRYPPLIPKGVRIRAQTRIIDLAPTLLELAGLPPATEFMGHSLVSVARKKTVDFDNLGISELFSVGRAMRSIRTREWKLTDDMVQKQRYYIDLIVDPDEHYPRPAHATEYGQKLLDRYKTVNHTLDVWRSRVFSDPDQPDLPEEVLKQLESLGYIERD
ncbi:MAG: sulfatase-like hydrolase/transferase [Planctomycetes bacterium]|nr:sulfatase-like hydrolase/transferase [Planctomycetota bacterium]